MTQGAQQEMSRSDRTWPTLGEAVLGVALKAIPTDPVNAPSHYQTDDGIECIDAIRAALGRDGFAAYCRGNAIKYAWRAGKKGSACEDMRKAVKYAEWAAQVAE